MTKKIKIYSRLIIIALFCVVAFTVKPLRAEPIPEDLFPVDAAMRERVDFWKRVYTEITSAQAFLHDMDDLSIVYKTIASQPAGGRGRNRAGEKEKKEISDGLREIVRKGREGLNEDEAKLLEIVKNKSDKELLEMSRNVRRQQGLKDRYYEGLVRGYPYLAMMKEIFERERLPTVLIFLPHVESSFNYRAYSKVGAAGMWQFMRSAASTYGLKMNYLVDERRDPFLSTRAAARFLRDNYRKLEAWPLALTAYNHGPRSMERAVDTLGTRDISKIIERYQNRRFGFASKNFYATFMATAEISQEPEKFFPNFPRNSLPPAMEISLKRSMTMDQIARVAGVSKDTLQDMNLGLRPTVFRGNFYLPKNFTVRVPVMNEAKVADVEVKMAKAEPVPAQNEAKQTESRIHIVRQGENLSQIARENGVEVAAVIFLNGIAKPSAIRVGMKLKLPEPGVKGAAPTIIADAGKPAAEAASPSEKPSYPSTGQELFEMELASRVPPHEPWDESAYKEAVVPEPSLEKAPLAAIEVEEKPGFFSRLFGSGDKKEESLPPPTEAVAPVPLESAGLLEFDPLAYNFDMTRVNPKQQRITVEINETLGHYSEWARTSPAVLRRLNRLGARAGLIQGKSFILPLDDSKAMEFHLQRIRFHQAIEEDLYAIYKITGEVDYKIEKGDTIASICRKLDLPFWLLRKYQPDISRSRLAVGRVIRVPTLQPIRPADEPSAAPDEPEGE